MHKSWQKWKKISINKSVNSFELWIKQNRVYEFFLRNILIAEHHLWDHISEPI